MCGINGIISNNKKKDLLRAQISKMNKIISHRGPDGEGVYCENGIALGHRRLSIIDLSENAAQPMFSASKRYVITFNGEIYNYKELRTLLNSKGVKLKTKSDTEVVLELFILNGVNSIHLLRGMFAFSIWDIKAKELYLFRDRIGIKPVYFQKKNNELIFSSEIKGVASVNTELSIDWDSFTNYFRTGLYTGNNTVFKEVKKLDPGHYIHYKATGTILKIKQYYNLIDNYNKPFITGTDDDLIDGFFEKLNETVKYHLVSDVPVASFLSGGLDSSMITALMRKNLGEKQLNSTSIVYHKNYSGANEESFSDIVANHLNTNHEKVYLESTIFSDMENLAWFSDEPFGIISSYAIYYLSAIAKKKNKVVLTGDGADEVLGGYYGLFQPLKHRYSNYRHILGFGSNFLKPMVSDNNTRIKSLYLRFVDYSQNNAYNFANQSSYNSTTILSLLNKNLLFKGLNNWKNNNRKIFYEELVNESDLRKKTYSLIRTRLVDEMLTKVDRMTMAQSLEARVPFLDHELIEYSIKLPDSIKYNIKEVFEQRNKYVLRKAAKKVLPNSIIDRKKQGFNVPINEWISKENKNIAEIIINGTLVNNNIVLKNDLEKFITNTSNRKAMPMLNMLCFEKWVKAYNNKLPNLKIVF